MFSQHTAKEKSQKIHLFSKGIPDFKMEKQEMYFSFITFNQFNGFYILLKVDIYVYCGGILTMNSNFFPQQLVVKFLPVS